MSDLPEHSSPKAARILGAAGDLLLARGVKGFTIADVATSAHVGKGTVYLYWSSKEDLLLGLIGRDFLAVADEFGAALAADPDLVRPSRQCPLLLRVAAERAFVRALQSHDELLGVLVDDPRSAALLDTLGPSAILHRLLPVWRGNGLARTDWSLGEQAYALHALVTGFIAVAGQPLATGSADPANTLSASVTALLGPERAGPDDIEAAAAAHAQLIDEARRTTLEIIARRETAATHA